MSEKRTIAMMSIAETQIEQRLYAEFTKMSEKRTISVNGRRLRVDKEMLSYEQVVALADLDPKSTPSITYKKGWWPKPEGILSPGQSVATREGLTLKVVDTGNA